MSQRKIRSYVYEGVMIVASILVAFTLDASWANYQESRLEHRILVELRDELASARTRIEASMAELEIVLASSREMIERVGPDTLPLTVAEAEALFTRILNLNTLEVPSSVLSSLVATGQLGLISRVQIRRALAEWPALVADVAENHTWHREETDDVLIPALAPYLAVRNIDYGEARTTSPSSFTLDPTGLQRDPKFETLLTWRVGRQEATYRESATLLQAAIDLIASIDAELE